MPNFKELQISRKKLKPHIVNPHTIPVAKNIPVLILLVAFACPLRLHAASVLANGEFTGTLAPWTTTGTLFNTGDAAVFSDSEATPAFLFQSGEVPGGLVHLELSFDFLNALSPDTPFGFLPDAFFATMYLGSSPFGPTLAGGVFDQVITLFDLDALGEFNTADEATFGPSPKGAGWTRFTLGYETAPEFTGPGFATVAFEFYNLNGTDSDSVMVVDNVSLIAVVPEPGAPLLLSLTALAMLLVRKRPQHLFIP